MELVISEKSELTALIENAVNNAMGRFNPKEQKPNRKLSFEDALNRLEELGYKTSESSLYKKTMAKTIPFKKYGRKIVFDMDELDKWAESELKSEKSNPVTKAVAESAGRKLGRA